MSINANIHTLKELKAVRDKLWDSYSELASTPITEYSASDRSTVYLRKKELREEIKYYDRRIALVDPKIDARGYNLAQIHPIHRGTPTSAVNWSLDIVNAKENDKGTVWRTVANSTEELVATTSDSYEPTEDGFFEFTPIRGGAYSCSFYVKSDTTEPLSVRAEFYEDSGVYYAKIDGGTAVVCEEGDRFRVGVDAFRASWYLKKADYSTTEESVNWVLVGESTSRSFGGKIKVQAHLTALNSAISQCTTYGFAHEIYRQA